MVQAAFGFDAAGTDLVTWATRAYLLGLTGHSLLEVAARAFYARKDARTPLLASLLSTAVFITVGLGLFRTLGAPGIGLANSLAFTIEALLLLLLIGRKFPSVLRQGPVLLRVTVGSALGGVAAWAIMCSISTPLPGAIAASAVGGAIGLVFLLPELRLLRRL